jgi:hypothetical protein
MAYLLREPGIFVYEYLVCSGGWFKKNIQVLPTSVCEKIEGGRKGYYIRE